MAMIEDIRNKKYRFIGESNAEYGPFSAYGPVSLVASGGLGTAELAIFTGQDFESVGEGITGDSDTRAKRWDFIGGERFMVRFTDCADVNAELNFEKW